MKPYHVPIACILLAAWAPACLGQKYTKIADAIKDIGDSDLAAETRLAAVEFLRDFASKDKSAVPASAVSSLKRFLTDSKDIRSRAGIATTLGELGKAGAPVLMDILNMCETTERDPRLAEVVMGSLARIGGDARDAAQGTLLKMLDSDSIVDTPTIFSTLESIGANREEVAARALRIAKRSAAIDAIKALEWAGPAAKDAVKKEAVEYLISNLRRDPRFLHNQDLIRRSIFALLAIDPNAKAALEPLRALLQSPELGKDAEQAIAKIKEGRVTATRPAVSRVLPVAEGGVSCVAFGPEGRIAAGYHVLGAPASSGVVVFDGRGERLGPAPLPVTEGYVTGVAFGPDGWIAAGYAGNPSGVVVFDGLRRRLRPAPLEVKDGFVTGVAFGPDGRIAACYGGDDARGRAVFGDFGGVVVLDARGERVRPAPLAVHEGWVTSVAIGPEGRIAAGYHDVDGRGMPGDFGGVVVFDAHGERLRPAPLAVKEGLVWGVAFGPEGRIAAGYLECVLEPGFQSLALRKQMIALAKWTKAR